MAYRNPLTVKAVELNSMKKRPVVIKYAGMELEGSIGEIQLAANDSSEFGSFDFELSEQSLVKYPNKEIPKNFTALEIEGIKTKEL